MIIMSIYGYPLYIPQNMYYSDLDQPDRNIKLSRNDLDSYSYKLVILNTN